MILMGVDPGLFRMGYGVIEIHGSRVDFRDGGVILGGRSSTPMSDRLVLLYDRILTVINSYRPESIAVEEVYSHYSYPNTAVLMGHARGIVCLAAGQNNVPVFDYASTKVKNAVVGSGRASKLQMQQAVQARLRLSTLPQPNDVSDALALAICHWQMARAVSMMQNIRSK